MSDPELPEFDREPWAQAVLTELGAAIREARKAAGMTQEALAEALDRTQTAVSYWEAGKRDPGVPDLLRIAEALNVPAASLLPDRAPKGAAEGREPELPEGIYGRVELPGMRSDTGWITEGTLGGQTVLVVRDWNGCPLGEYILGPACRLVHLPTPLKRPETQERAAITSGRGWDEDDDWERNPF